MKRCRRLRVEFPNISGYRATGNEEVLSVRLHRTAAKADGRWRKVARFDFGERVIAPIRGSAESPAPIVTRKGEAPVLL